MRRRSLAGIVVILVTALVLSGIVLYRPGSKARGVSPAFVGVRSCAACHQPEFQQWKNSHHDLAMQPATADTVLGDFNDAEFADAGVTTRFSRLGERFVVRTEGPGGKVDDFPIKYTFGVEPLQQYLIELGGGRMQALTVAWDTRNKKWFSLYPGRNTDPGDWLHWTQRGQNWNSNCAECHSTNLKKNYDLTTDTYQTTWSEVNVSCEACHGPGSDHVAWARGSSLERWWRGYGPGDKGLVNRLKDPHRQWGLDEKGQPALQGDSDRDPSPQVQACALCHSRRGPVSVEHRHGDDFVDHFTPQVLQENIYHPDGQILDEAYEYGSFLQSKMYHRGVRCSDCHNPHTLKPIATGNGLCVRCHAPAKYDVPTHHFHPPGSTGASCVECHMPEKTYMVVDRRRDHSLRIPRPDLSRELGTPDACSACHSDKPLEWSVEAFQKWYGDRTREGHYGSAFRAAWTGKPEAGDALRGLLANGELAPYVRASAAAALQGYLSEAVIETARDVLDDPDPLVRSNSAALLAALPPEERVTRLAPLLSDPVRLVRQTAARALASTPRKALTPEQAEQFDATLHEQTEALRAHADNVGGRLALGALYEETGKLEEAVAAYQFASSMDPLNIDAKMAWTELLIRQGRDEQAESLLGEMLAQPKPPELTQATWERAQGTIRYQLGLLLASNPARIGEGVRHLREAARQLPRSGRLRYNLGQALIHQGDLDEALRVLSEAHQLDDADTDVMLALVHIYAANDQWEQALQLARQMARRAPGDPGVRQLILEVENKTLQHGSRLSR